MKLKNPEIRFETTNKCAYHCKICPRELMTRDQGVMTMELFKKIIDEAIPLGLTHVTLTGFGEAMLDKHFLDRVKYCKSKNLYVSMDTTGYLLKDKIIEGLLKYEFDFIRFSVFATTKDVYKEVHNLDTFDLSIQRINKLLDLKKQNNFSYPKTGVYFVIQKENQHQIDDFIKYWNNRVDEVDVWKSHNWIDTYDYREKSRKRKKTCGRPQSGPLQIRWDGQISACCFDFNNQLITGDLSKQSFKEFFLSDKLQNLVSAHNKGDMSNYSICENCDQMYETPDALYYSNNPNNKLGTSGNTFISFDESL